MKRDLTLKQALVEAQKRWGSTAMVQKDRGLCRIMDAEFLAKHPNEKLWHRNAGRCTGFMNLHPKDCPGGQPSVKIGNSGLGGLFFVVEGQGRSFREAFERYDRRKALEHAQYVAATCKRRGRHRPGSICGMCNYEGPRGKELSATADAENMQILRARVETTAAQPGEAK